MAPSSRRIHHDAGLVVAEEVATNQHRHTIVVTHSAGSTSTPGRAGPGQHVSWPEDKGGLPPQEITIACGLRTNGHSLACIGKWHLGPEMHPSHESRGAAVVVPKQLL